MLEIMFILIIVYVIICGVIDGDKFNRNIPINHFDNGLKAILVSTILPIIIYGISYNVNPLIYWDNILGLTFINLTIRMITFPLVFNKVAKLPTLYIGTTATIDKLLGNLYWYIAFFICLPLSVVFYLFLTI